MGGGGEGGKERILRCKEEGGKTEQSSLASFHAEVISMQLQNKRTRIQAKKERKGVGIWQERNSRSEK